MSTKIISIIILVVFIIAILIGVIFVFQNNKIAVINSFEECALAGYPIMESYPEQCKTPDGRNFIRTIIQMAYQLRY
ncbi:MAG: Periplasmic ligand-binding sensor protein [Parcubacteria group bacterium GW2011_GWA2_33_14]|nr:MAG: Periplasmic ligand-binding sensor protein [Parcubacteria group bacterium GW2011_GWA2_33_14]